jgi:hypothetical protein
MAFWLSNNWFYHTDPRRSGRYYVGHDQAIYDAQGNPTGYELKTQVYISGRAGNFSVDAHGGCGDMLPFEELPATEDARD